MTKQNEGLLYEEDGTPAARTARVLAATPMGELKPLPRYPSVPVARVGRLLARGLRAALRGGAELAGRMRAPSAH